MKETKEKGTYVADFVRECCVVGESENVPVQELLDTYRRWGGFGDDVDRGEFEATLKGVVPGLRTQSRLNVAGVLYERYLGVRVVRWAASAWGPPAPEAPGPDPVNHPPHYTQGGVECIDAIEAALGPEQFAGFLRGQVMKYVWRGPHKECEAEDYGKALWYLKRLAKLAGHGVPYAPAQDAPPQEAK